MIKKRFVIDKFIEDYKSHIIDDEREIETLSEFVEYLNKLTEENKELKEEVQLLKEGIEAYENAIPYVCTCGQVNDIHSEMFDFWMKQNKFYMEHPSRCTVIIDGVRYK